MKDEQYMTITGSDITEWFQSTLSEKTRHLKHKGETDLFSNLSPNLILHACVSSLAQKGTKKASQKTGKVRERPQCHVSSSLLAGLAERASVHSPCQASEEKNSTE